MATSRRSSGREIRLYGSASGAGASGETGLKDTADLGISAHRDGGGHVAVPAGCSAASVVLEVARQVAHAVPDRVVLHELALAGQYALEHLVLGGHLVEHLIGDLLQLAQYRLGSTWAFTPCFW